MQITFNARVGSFCARDDARKTDERTIEAKEKNPIWVAERRTDNGSTILEMNQSAHATTPSSKNSRRTIEAKHQKLKSNMAGLSTEQTLDGTTPCKQNGVV